MLYREDLDTKVTRGCLVPGCHCHGEHDGVLFMACPDCLSSDLKLAYKDGVLYVGCEECQKTLANIQVAARSPQFN